MKKIFFSVLVVAFVLVSCKKTEETVVTEETEVVTNDTTVVVTDTVSTEAEPAVESLYSCSMHPEVQGKLNDKCSKCGMELSELVPKKQ